MLLAVECRALGLTLKKSLVIFCKWGTGIFAAKPFGMGDVVGEYYEKLVYDNMTQLQPTTKTYRETLMQDTVNTSPRNANWIPATVKDR